MSKNFKQARIEANLTQTDIGNRIGITVQTVNKWERGRCPVARHHWKTLSSLLNLTEDELECVLVQTLLDSCIERSDKRPLQNAVVSMLYRAELLKNAIAAFDRNFVSEPVRQIPDGFVSKSEYLEMKEKYLNELEQRMRLENEVKQLREQLSRTPRRTSALSESTTINQNELETEVKK